MPTSGRGRSSRTYGLDTGRLAGHETGQPQEAAVRGPRYAAWKSGVAPLTSSLPPTSLESLPTLGGIRIEEDARRSAHLRSVWNRSNGLRQ